MTTVLVVDDEPRYRDYLQRVLGGEGYQVTVAESGRQAIALGARCRPDIVVADWMLKDHVHGLHVVSALRAVKPDVQAVLITGFPTQDLEEAVQEAGFADFIRKPFELDRIRAAVRLAASAGVVRPATFGVAELDEAGRVVYASPMAENLLEAPGSGLREGLFVELFDPPADLDATVKEWGEVSPRRGSPPLRLRAQPSAEDGSRWVALATTGRGANEPLAEMTLGLFEPGTSRWPRKGRALVVDDNALVRAVGTALIESAGATCYSAPTHEAAIGLVDADPGIEVVLLDFDMPDGDIGDLIAQLRALRPNLVLVGNSGEERRADFAERGCPLYLQKPWRLDALLRALGPAPDTAP